MPQLLESFPVLRRYGRSQRPNLLAAPAGGGATGRFVMCGIVGVMSTRSSVSEGQIRGMSACLAHRGPDDCGTWLSKDAAVGIGHRRLAILDLSAEGHQPKCSVSERFVVSYNGEIYNFQELKSELAAKGHQFRGTSDTEVLLAAIEEWGFERSLPRLTGMFAIAVWDLRERRLHLARDRMGEKPLYYGWSNGSFLFASELSAVRAHPGFVPEVNRAALTKLLRHGYVPAPLSIYRGVFKLPAGCYLTVDYADADGVPQSFSEYADGDANLRPQRYWSLAIVAGRDNLHSFDGGPEDAYRRLTELLTEAVSRQMVSDVPLGAFLSGGIDSSTIVALMQRCSTRPIRTFSIGFNEEGYNEAPYAKRIAAYLGTEHTELYVSPREMLEVVPNLPRLYSDPFADSSQIPTVLVAQLARQKVTVALSGDGGDELFGGYPRYFFTQKLWGAISPVPRPIRSLLAKSIEALTPKQWNLILRPFAPLMPKSIRRGEEAEKLLRAAALLPSKNSAELYYRLFSIWSDAESVVRGATPAPTIFLRPDLWPTGVSEFELMMWLDSVHYLPDDILVKVDRAAMASSLETRVPFLDHRVVEFAWSLPPHLRINPKEPKWLLRRILSNHIPKDLFERPKMGFGAPVDQWLRGPLREWAEELLREKRLREEGFFEPAPIREKWAEHMSGRRNWQAILWNVLMFQSWHEANRASAG